MVMVGDKKRGYQCCIWEMIRSCSELSSDAILIAVLFVVGIYLITKIGIALCFMRIHKTLYHALRDHHTSNADLYSLTIEGKSET